MTADPTPSADEFLACPPMAHALALGPAQRRDAVARWICSTPGTLGEKGAWRLRGHRLSVDWCAERLAEAFFPPEGESACSTLSEAAARVADDYGIEPDECPEMLLAACCFLAERPEEFAAQCRERRRQASGWGPHEAALKIVAERERERLDRAGAPVRSAEPPSGRDGGL